MDMDKKLNATVKAFWNAQDKTAKTGLVILNDCMLHFAANGDWSPLGRFLARSGKYRPILKNIVEASFGTANVSLAVASAEAKGLAGELKFKIIKKWDGNNFPLEQQNGYGIIKEAVDNGMGFTSQALHDKVKATLGKDKPAKGKADKDTLEKLEHMFKYIVGKMKDDQDLTAELADLKDAFEKRIAARRAQAEPAF